MRVSWTVIALLACSGAKTSLDSADTDAALGDDLTGTVTTAGTDSATGTGTITTGDCESPVVIINELAPRGTDFTDEYGEDDDWLELHNPTDSAIDLVGWGISDKYGEELPYRFPAGAMIEAREYGIVWADDMPDQGPLHVPFKLSSDGETVVLVDPDDCVVATVSFPATDTSSWGLWPDLVGEYVHLDLPTPGGPNAEPSTSGTTVTTGTTGTTGTTSPSLCEAPIMLNELMAANDSTIEDEAGEYDDWFELYNPSDDPVDISGWTASDFDPFGMNSDTPWTFPAGTVVPAGGHLLVWADDDEDQGPLHADFKLSADGEVLALVDSMGCLADLVEFDEQADDASWGRAHDGAEVWMTVDASPGAPN